jgi:hypothetical protein
VTHTNDAGTSALATIHSSRVREQCGRGWAGDPCDSEGRSRTGRSRASRNSPKVRLSMPSTVRRRDRPDRLPSFAAIARVAGVLAAGLIRDDRQAHPALARVGERLPSPTPTSLPVRTIFISLGRAPSDPAAGFRSSSRLFHEGGPSGAFRTIR